MGICLCGEGASCYFASSLLSSIYHTYADKDSISKEIREIKNALANGIPAYELKYSAKVKRHWLSIKIVND